MGSAATRLGFDYEIGLGFIELKKQDLRLGGECANQNEKQEAQIEDSNPSLQVGVQLKTTLSGKASRAVCPGQSNPTHWLDRLYSCYVTGYFWKPRTNVFSDTCSLHRLFPCCYWVMVLVCGTLQKIWLTGKPPFTLSPHTTSLKVLCSRQTPSPSPLPQLCLLASQPDARAQIQGGGTLPERSNCLSTWSRP